MRAKDRVAVYLVAALHVQFGFHGMKLHTTTSIHDPSHVSEAQPCPTRVPPLLEAITERSWHPVRVSVARHTSVGHEDHGLEVVGGRTALPPRHANSARSQHAHEVCVLAERVRASALAARLDLQRPIACNSAWCVNRLLPSCQVCVCVCVSRNVEDAKGWCTAGL